MWLLWDEMRGINAVCNSDSQRRERCCDPGNVTVRAPKSISDKYFGCRGLVTSTDPQHGEKHVTKNVEFIEFRGTQGIRLKQNWKHFVSDKVRRVWCQVKWNCCSSLLGEIEEQNAVTGLTNCLYLSHFSNFKIYSNDFVYQWIRIWGWVSQLRRENNPFFVSKLFCVSCALPDNGNWILN